MRTNDYHSGSNKETTGTNEETGQVLFVDTAIDAPVDLCNIIDCCI